MPVDHISKSVCRIVRLEKDDSGNFAPVVIYETKAGRRKISEPLRPLEKVVRRIASAQSTYLSTYLAKHERSNVRSRDGWLRDLTPNILDAAKQGQKKLRIKRLILK
jgi:hypothetical protein